MWVANSDCIQAPVTFPPSKAGRWRDAQREREREREREGETSRCVLSLAVETIYCSQKTDTGSHRQGRGYHYRRVLLLNQKSHFYLAKVWAKQWNWSGIDQNARTALSSKGDFIDLPKSFSIIASVKCRNSSFRWVGITGKNTAWTIYRSLK